MNAFERDNIQLLMHIAVTQQAFTSTHGNTIKSLAKRGLIDIDPRSIRLLRLRITRKGYNVIAESCAEVYEEFRADEADMSPEAVEARKTYNLWREKQSYYYDAYRGQQHLW